MSSAPIHVAVAVVVNEQGEVLLAQRSPETHLGGYWEFPGGKLEHEENVEDALARELAEEVGVTVTHCRPLIRIYHDYPDKTVLLDTWYVDGYKGIARGQEGQSITWVAPTQLSQWRLPPADAPIINALLLPDRYLITPDCYESQDRYLNALGQALESGSRLLQFRVNNINPQDWEQLARLTIELCHQKKVHVLLNALPQYVADLGADGVHLTSADLCGLESRPLGREYWVGASCHNEAELRHANRIGVDFAVVSPVCKTLSHPESKPMGWDEFQRLTELASMPIYALGGMAKADTDFARRCGGQGIAAIRSLWGEISDYP